MLFLFLGKAFVPGTGFEPAQPFGCCHLKTVRLPISPPGQGCKYNKTANLGLQTSNLKQLYTHIKIPQCIIQNCFKISTWFALTNDQCTTNTKLTCRKFFCIASRYHYASCRHTTFHLSRFAATYINDLC